MIYELVITDPNDVVLHRSGLWIPVDAAPWHLHVHVNSDTQQCEFTPITSLIREALEELQRQHPTGEVDPA